MVRNTRAATIPLVAPVADLPISEEDFDIEDDEESLYERLEGDDISSVAVDVNVPLTIPSAVPGLSSSLSSLALASAPIVSLPSPNLTYSAAVIGNLSENPSLATTSVVNASLPTTSVVDTATATASASSQPMVEIAESNILLCLAICQFSMRILIDRLLIRFSLILIQDFMTTLLMS